MGLLSSILTLFGRSGEDALSVPPMDGVFKPNSLLEAAERIVPIAGVDNIALAAGQLHMSSGNTLYRLELSRRAASPIVAFDAPVTAIAAADNGRLAVATQDGRLSLVEPGGDVVTLPSVNEGSTCVTSGVFEDDDTLVLTVGSLRHAMSDWKRDLMSHGASGCIVRHRLSSGTTEVMSGGLAFPYGLVRLAGGGFAVSESWRHRIVSAPASGAAAPITLLGELPAYPARLAPSSDGGFWLALFAPRRQLTELVLSDDDYRLDMMATIPAEAWIGPDFADQGDGEQPLQAGSVRQMGIMKPWAPSRSYGLVVRLDNRMQPVASYHSRADGRVHGIASVTEFDGSLYVASRGAGMIARLDLSERASA